MESRKIILATAYENQGDFFKCYHAFENKQVATPNEQNTSEQAIVIFDKDYPQNLKTSSHPPFALFYQGNKNLLKSARKHIGFVDDIDQEDTEEGKYNREKILTDLNTDYICVLRHDLYKDNKTLVELKKLNRNEIILILAQGIDTNEESVKYVLEHNGLVVSICPSITTEPYENSLIASRELLANLSDFIYVNEIKESGLITVGCAMFSKRNIFIGTSPYSNFSALRKNNELIKGGVEMITCGLEIDTLLLQ